MGFTANSTGIRKLLLVIIVLFALGALGYCSQSSAAEHPGAGLSISFGTAAVGGEQCFDSMLIAQELQGRSWLAYLDTHGKGTCRGDELIRANVGAGILRTTHLGKWAIGLGAGLLEHGDSVVGPREILGDSFPRVAPRPQFCANILIRRYLFHGRAVFDALHCSTGGSTYFNTGLNLFTLGVRF